MRIWRGLFVASLVGAALWWTSLPAREELREPRVRRLAAERLVAPRHERLRSRDAMKLVLLSCFQSR